MKRYVSKGIPYEVMKWANSPQKSVDEDPETDDSEYKEDKEDGESSSDDELGASVDPSSDSDSDIRLSIKSKKNVKRRVDSKREVSNKRVKASRQLDKTSTSGVVGEKKAKQDSRPLPGERGKKRAQPEEKPSQDVDAVGTFCGESTYFSANRMQVVGDRKSKRRKIIESRIRETMAVGASEEGSTFTENDVQQAVYHQIVIGVRTP
jgi:hypothetical protein